MDKESGEMLERRRFNTSEKNLAEIFRSMKGHVHVNLEASELAGWVRRVVKPIVTRVIVSHPKSNAWIGKDPLKCDRVDAAKLAEMLRSGTPHEVFYPDEDGRLQFKRLVQHYDRLTRQQAALKRSIKTHLRVEGIIVKNLAPFTVDGRKTFLAQVASTVARTSIKQLYDVLEATRRAQVAAERAMRKEAKKYPEIAMFEEVPGIGPILACRFSAYIQNPHRFANKRKVWRYCRLGVAWRTSDGKPLSRQHLDTNGCGALKDLSRKAFDASMRCHDDNAFKRTFSSTLMHTQDKIHARLTVQRKIVATLWAMWKKGEPYQDEYKG